MDYHDNPFDDYLPEPPAFVPKKPVVQLSQKQMDKARELGITPECAQQLLTSLRRLFRVPAVLDGKRTFPLIALYYTIVTHEPLRIPKAIQEMAVQISDIGKYRIVQVPYKRLIDYMADLPNAKIDPVCSIPYFD
jgi:hypothetical protein